MIQKLRRLTGRSIEDLNSFVIDATEAFNKLIRDPFFSRQKISAQLTTAPTVLAHSLGREPKSIVVTGINANAVVWTIAVGSTTITLQASANCIVSVEIY